MYSQNDEEKYILAELADITNGSYLDIGAFEPFKFSNTRALFENGWSGVLVEPGLPQLKKLRVEYENVDRITICDKAIAEEAGIHTFYVSDYSDAISTMSTDHVKLWTNHECTFTESEVLAITVDDLFNTYGYNFNFINVDVEGGNLDIIQKMPFDKLVKLKAICVEYDNHYNAINEILARNGFNEIYRNGENIVASGNNK